MASAQRIENLKIYCEQWQESYENLIKRRDDLLSLQRAEIKIFESNGAEDLLPDMIKEVDDAAKKIYAILIRMQALHDRAVAGEDV